MAAEHIVPCVLGLFVDSRSQIAGKPTLQAKTKGVIASQRLSSKTTKKSQAMCSTSSKSPTINCYHRVSHSE